MNPWIERLLFTFDMKMLVSYAILEILNNFIKGVFMLVDGLSRITIHTKMSMFLTVVS